MSRRILIIGSGVVGAALAAALSSRDDVDVTLVDRAPQGALMGSTGFDPGFLGALSDSPIMTEIAQGSAAVYDELSGPEFPAYQKVGSVEVAQSSEEWTSLNQRAKYAASVGVTARLVDASEAQALAPRFVDESETAGGLHFPDDATARADLITSALLARAAAQGVTFRNGLAVNAIKTAGGRIRGARIGASVIEVDDIVIAAGVWGTGVAQLAGVQLPIIAAATPYVYGPFHELFASPSPFVRWPEYGVFARDHGPRDGLGTYDHSPVGVDAEQLSGDAELPWSGDDLDEAIGAARQLVPEANRFGVLNRLNCVYPLTPDTLPLLGAHADIGGLWVAEGIRLAHAAGAAALLARAIYASDLEVLPLALDPNRFSGQPAAALRQSALNLYGTA